ncbi:hypothetical protein Ssi03_69170 [Sphaerisporangium siamense]|uniref:Ubiquitin-protein ligase n=1 Tax=Sphaerisporangium siamense TaxID=795645 RepID=A0A7W7D5D4_9ACTN|nr:hypothetical protein [Sphaerisporangium siamense]MBB4700543.1 ubiquitin-protein ligase [Sphaerisporangium siamense]GII88927.1 hypothetical protein Ssi03_69170 [Sphaerisporangium siamense]
MSDYDYVVPRGMLIMEGDASKRLYLEQQKLKTYFPQFGFSQSSRTGELGVTGRLRTNSGARYPLSLQLTENYPYEFPYVFPVGWDSTCPHVYPAGNLCIMRPDQWRPFYSIAFAIAKSAIWLNKFEVFKRRGYWPGNEQDH